VLLCREEILIEKFKRALQRCEARHIPMSLLTELEISAGLFSTKIPLLAELKFQTEFHGLTRIKSSSLGRLPTNFLIREN
jgi:hypothetical protein